MIKIFNATDVDFSSNGEKIIKPLVAKVFKEDNGKYYIDLETTLDYVSYLKQGNIVVTNTIWGEQAFRINNIEQSTSRVKCRAKHVYFDCANYILEDVYPQNLSGAAAINWVLSRTIPANIFTGSSDIADAHSARYVRKSLEKVMAEMVETWGGHLTRDNFNIGLNASIGADRGVTIRYGKNITGIKAEENWDSVVTQLMPVGYDGILLPEKYLYSTINYETPYCKAVKFNIPDGIDTADTNAIITDLRTQAQKYLTKNQYPQVNYTVNAHLDNVVDIGDTIHVIHEKLGIELLTNVIAATYNCITKKFTSIEFGNFRQTLNSIITNPVNAVKEELKTSTSFLQKELNASVATLNKYLFESHVYQTENATYYLDTDSIDTATKFMIISLGGIGFGTKTVGQAITDATYTTLWDINGNFNASAITTGVLRSISIESININNNDKLIIDAEGNLTSTGKLIASDAMIKGIIQAISGQIGPFTISNEGLISPHMQFYDSGINPFMWMQNDDRSQHANYQGDIVVVRTADGQTRQSTSLDSRHSYMQGIEMVKESINSNEDLEGTRIETTRYSDHGISYTSIDSNANYIFSILGNTVFMGNNGIFINDKLGNSITLSNNGIFIRDKLVNTITMGDNGINIGNHLGGNINMLSYGTYINSAPNTDIYLNGNSVNGIVNNISTMQSDISRIKNLMGLT